jgi:rare lipoprotein A
MVRTLSFFLLLFVGVTASAQKYSSDDTVTEYTMNGTVYHNKFEGRKTANGEIFNHNLFTAAHRKFKFGTLLLVTSQKSGLSVIVKVNDRCPKKTVLDMTRRAAYGIGIKGCQPVKVRVLPPSFEEAWASQDALFDSVASRLATGKYALHKQTKASKKKKDTPEEGKNDVSKKQK